MQSNPIVSVIMSVYNSEEYLMESIDSILNQTFENYEFIIIDDGSTDNSAKIIQTSKDRRIRLLRNHKNIGLPLSLNKAIKLSRGQYIARMDADDIAPPYRLERQVNYLYSNSHVDILGGQVVSIDINGVRIKNSNKPLKSSQINKAAEFSCPLNHPTYMVKKEIYEELDGYREIFTYGQDYDFILRAIDRGFVIKNMPDILLYYRIYPGSQSIEKRRKQLFLTRHAIKLHHQRLSAEGEESDCTLLKIKNITFKNNYLFSISWKLRNKLLRSDLKKSKFSSVANVLIIVISVMHYEVFYASLRGFRYNRLLNN